MALVPRIPSQMNQLASGEGFSRQGLPLSSFPSFTCRHISPSLLKQPVLPGCKSLSCPPPPPPSARPAPPARPLHRTTHRPARSMSLMCPCSSLFLAPACKTTVVKLITSIIIIDYTLQAFLTGCSEALVEVFCCPQLPRKPPVSLLIIMLGDFFYKCVNKLTLKRVWLFNSHFLAAILGSLLKALLSQVLVTRPATCDAHGKRHISCILQVI